MYLIKLGLQTGCGKVKNDLLGTDNYL